VECCSAQALYYHHATTLSTPFFKKYGKIFEKKKCPKALRFGAFSMRVGE
jgi:hypothetical protein